jgi:hypothetical protein
MPRKAKKVAAAPAPVAENTTPKKRGRKPGSKNKVVGKKRGRKPSKPAVNVFEAIEKELKMMAGALKKAKTAAAKEMAKVEAKAAKSVIRAEAKAEKKIAKLRERLKAKRRKKPGKPGPKRKPGRPKLKKVAGRRGRPAKRVGRGGRPRKGQPTKKTMIVDFVKDFGKPITSGQLIDGLFAVSGEKDKKRFSQGIYTTLTQIYKNKVMLKDAKGMITLPK